MDDSFQQQRFAPRHSKPSSFGGPKSAVISADTQRTAARNHQVRPGRSRRRLSWRNYHFNYHLFVACSKSGVNSAIFFLQRKGFSQSTLAIPSGGLTGDDSSRKLYLPLMLLLCSRQQRVIYSCQDSCQVFLFPPLLKLDSNIVLRESHVQRML